MGDTGEYKKPKKDTLYNFEGKTVRQDMNFIYSPLWLANDREAWDDIEAGLIEPWNNEPDPNIRPLKPIIYGKRVEIMEGYFMTSTHRPLTRNDYIILLSIQYLCQQAGWDRKVKTTHRELLIRGKLSTNGDAKNRINEALDRMASIQFHFKGTFYDGKKHIEQHLGLVDSWAINGKWLEIELNEYYLKAVKNSSYAVFFEPEKMIKLKTSMAIRLYEYLLAHLSRRDFLKIGSEKLIKRLTIKKPEKLYYLTREIKAALKKINDMTSLYVDFKILQQRKGKATYLITKQKEQPCKQLAFLPECAHEYILARYKTKVLVSMVGIYQAKFGADYVIKNIQYTNARAKTGYSAYLQKALEENYAQAALPKEKEKKPIPPPETCQDCGGDIRPYNPTTIKGGYVQFENAMCGKCKTNYIYNGKWEKEPVEKLNQTGLNMLVSFDLSHLGKVTPNCIKKEVVSYAKK